MPLLAPRDTRKDGGLRKKRVPSAPAANFLLMQSRIAKSGGLRQSRLNSMKTFGLLLVLSAGVAFAGSEVVMQESSTTVGLCCGDVPHIPQPIMQGIKDLAVRQHPTRPKTQMETITADVCAYLKLQTIADNPAKRAAEADFPFDFSKQLYLAQRPLQF